MTYLTISAYCKLICHHENIPIIKKGINMGSDELRIVHSENPVKEMWSRLSYFETEHNTRQFLKKFSLSNDNLIDTARSLAFTMKTAREYYESADRVSLLTQPLLIFYGMTALSKVLFTATHGIKSPSKGHGLETPKPGDFEELSTKVKKDGTFPQFHSCYSKEKLSRRKFTMKELLSLVPEIKVEYETVYNEKSRSLKALRGQYGIQVVDTEIEKYGNLVTDLIKFFPEIKQPQQFENSVTIFQRNVPTIRAVSGEEFLVLPLKRHDKNLFLPEMSIHFLAMYLLGMISRYHPKEWGEIIEGEKSGEIYIIQKFLEITTRKFPNLILNKLRNRDFIFVSPQLETEKRLDRDKLEQIYEFVSRKMADELNFLI
jgi:hypothetical protein